MNPRLFLILACTLCLIGSATAARGQNHKKAASDDDEFGEFDDFDEADTPKKPAKAAAKPEPVKKTTFPTLTTLLSKKTTTKTRIATKNSKTPSRKSRTKPPANQRARNQCRPKTAMPPLLLPPPRSIARLVCPMTWTRKSSSTLWTIETLTNSSRRPRPRNPRRTRPNTVAATRRRPIRCRA